MRYTNNRKLYSKISYSQSGEDCLVKFIFDAIGYENPTYIDIGAHHPFYLNNTALFYNLGCNGINIEPNPDNYKLFQKYRKRDTNLNIGIGLTQEVLNYYKLDAPTLNTFSKEEAEKHQKESGYKIIDTIKVKTDTLKNVIAKNFNGKFPDFLTIDVEGMDEEILFSIDYKNNAPTIICTETLSFSENGNGIKNNNIIDFLKNHDYLVYADTFINTIFVNNEKWKRMK
jgi:FkbM family methyltransferase